MNQFSYHKTFLIGFGFFGISIIWPLFNSLIPPMLEDLGLSAVVVGFIMTWDNIINMFVQPWVGSLSDRTHTRFGRRKPFMMAGAPLAAIFFILVPFVRENFVLIGLMILGTNLGMALFRAPTIAYLGDLFRPQDRSKANGVINLMGGVASAIALFTGGALYKMGVPLPFIAGSGVMLVAILIVLVFVRETRIDEPRADAEPEPGFLDNLQQVVGGSDRRGLLLLGAILFWFVGWNAMEAFFTIYARSVLEIDIGTGTQMLTAFAATFILFAIPSGLIATRIGRRPTILTGLVGMFLGLIAGFFIRSQLVLLGTLAIMGVFWSLVNINSLPMVYDLGGEQSIGAFTGMYYFSSSAAAITGPILGGWTMDIAGYGAIWLFSALFIGLAILSMYTIKTDPDMAAP